MLECPGMARPLYQGFLRQFRELTGGYPGIIVFSRQNQTMTAGFVDRWGLLVWE